MTKQEIETRFKAGEELINIFGIRKNYYRIGDSSITERQFYALKKLPHLYRIEVGGLTKHIYKYEAE